MKFLDLTTNRLDQMQIRDIISSLNLEREIGAYNLVLFDKNQDINYLNNLIESSNGLILIGVSDEASEFNYLKLYNGNYVLYIQTPNQFETKHIKARFFGCGYGLATKYNSFKTNEKKYDVFFSGQINHKRRELAKEILEQIKPNYNVYANYTAGFTQGLAVDEYHKALAESKIVLCPSGVVTQDSLRFYESLEMGAIPIIDVVSPIYGKTDYWDYVAPNYLLKYETKEQAIKLINEVMNDYELYQAEVQEWWQNYKDNFKHNLEKDIETILTSK